MKNLTLFVLIVFFSLLSVNIVSAGVPFNNLEGVGGVAFNPLAYPAGTSFSPEEKKDLGNAAQYFGKPRLGTWYVNLSDVDISWYSVGISETFLDRIELSYGYQNIGQQDAKTHEKHNLGAKLLLVPENFHNLNFVPAISMGGIYKHTDTVIPGSKKEGWDAYLVATKLITQLPIPVLISGGGLFTTSYATGALGYDSNYEPTFFGNVDFVLTDKIIVGAEYKQGAHFDSFKNADYWEAHLAYTPNNHITLIGAYVDAGDHEATGEVGLGDGVVFSIQYAF